MIINSVAGVVRKSFRLSHLLALALLLPLIVLLTPAPASARLHGGWGYHHARYAYRAPGHRGWAHLQRRPVRIATYVRRSHARRFARLWHHRLNAFAAAQPRLNARPAVSYEGGGVIAEAMRYVGAGNVTGMRGAWCADYASMVLRRAGHRGLGSRMVSSAFSYGPRVSNPKPGDLVVLSGRRGYASHVGFFAGYRNGQVLMVSGNWGHRVSVAPISRRSVAAFIGV